MNNALRKSALGLMTAMSQIACPWITLRYDKPKPLRLKGGKKKNLPYTLYPEENK